MDQSSFSVSLPPPPALAPSAWAVCPLFTADCVEAALHSLPLFSGPPPQVLLPTGLYIVSSLQAFLQLLSSRGPTPVLIKFALAKATGVNTDS